MPLTISYPADLPVSERRADIMAAIAANQSDAQSAANLRSAAPAAISPAAARISLGAHTAAVDVLDAQSRLAGRKRACACANTQSQQSGIAERACRDDLTDRAA